MEAIDFHIKLTRDLRVIPLADVIIQHVKVMHILSGYDAHLNLDKEVITIAPIINAKSNLKMTQDSIDRADVS